MTNYSELFRAFLGLLPGSESLDDDKVLPPSVRLKRADYLLFGRSVIAEVKQLEDDPAFKVDAIIDRYKAHPAFPVFYGQLPLMRVLEHMPDEIRQEILETIYGAITRSIREGCEQANRQIRDTRAFLGLPDAAGLLFMLNDRIPILSPNVLARRLAQQLNKRTPDGSHRFPEIAYACSITWAHLIQADDGTAAHPIILVEGPASSANPTAREQLDHVVKAWSEYSGAKMLGSDLTTRAMREQLEDYHGALPDDDIVKP